MLHILQGANRQKEYIATQGICFGLNRWSYFSRCMQANKRHAFRYRLQSYIVGHIIKLMKTKSKKITRYKTSIK